MGDFGMLKVLVVVLSPVLKSHPFAAFVHTVKGFLVIFYTSIYSISLQILRIRPRHSMVHR
jgi:hypothetical protein